MTLTRPMRRIFFAALLCLAIAPPAAAQKINLPTVSRTKLDNGVEVILMEYHRAPTLTVIATFPGGESIETPEKAGAASLTAALLRRGTTTRDAQQIAEQIDFLGGSLDPGAGDDRVSVSLGVLAKDTDAGLDLMADVIRHPTFPGPEIERERQLALAGLESMREDPGAIADRVATETVFAGHTYGIMPTITSLKAITRDDLLAYYQRVVAPDHMILVAVGDFKTADMLAKVRQRFGDWPRNNEPAPNIPAPKNAPAQTILIDKPDATQTQARFVRAGFARSSPDYLAGRLAGGMLGGSFTSRLISEVRIRRSLTYDIGSAFETRLRGGDFVISSFTKIESTRPLIDATRTVLEQTATKGFQPAELQSIKSYMAGLFAIRVQTPEALAGQLADIAFYGLPADYLETYIARMRAVPLSETNRVARQYFSPSSLSLVLVAPAQQVQNQLKGLGQVQVRPVAQIGQ